MRRYSTRPMHERYTTIIYAAQLHETKSAQSQTAFQSYFHIFDNEKQFHTLNVCRFKTIQCYNRIIFPQGLAI